MKKLNFFILLIVLFISVFYFLNLLDLTPTQMTYKIDLMSEQKDIYQIYYSKDKNEGFKEEQSVKKEYTSTSSFEVLAFPLSTQVNNIRLDLGNTPGQLKIKRVSLDSLFNSYAVDLFSLTKNNSNQLSISYKEDVLLINTQGNDPYIFVDIDNSLKEKVIKDNVFAKKILMLFVSLIVSTIGSFILLKRRTIIDKFYKIYDNKRIIYNLAKNDFKTKYAGSYFGILWAFVNPIITIVIYWFVFQVGFKAGPVQEAPFALWFIVGIVPWFFFADAFSNATNSLIEYSYLVKKIVFQIKILPIVKILSALFVHLFFILFALIIYMLYGYTFNLYVIQIIYYSICTAVLVMSLSLITSSIIVFFKDLGQIIGLILQFGMWLTPIIWNYTMVPVSYRWLLKMNPMYYIVEGYRDSFINQVWFWERYNQTFYFWVSTVIIFTCGYIVFKKLRPHFADVL